MTTITENSTGWALNGDVLMGNANAVLTQSQGLTLQNQAVVDFAGVADVDTAAVSLMFEWLRRAKAEGKTLRFANCPSGLASLTDLYGVTDML